MERDDVQSLVGRILADPAAYESLRQRLSGLSGEELEALLRAVDSSNPPVLGTGGTE